MSTIKGLSGPDNVSRAGAGAPLPDPSGALAIAELLNRQSLPPGTAAMVAELVEKLGGGSPEPTEVATSTLLLSKSDDFHFGLSERIEELAADLERAGSKGRLEVRTESRGNEFEMALEISGPAKAVNDIKAQVAHFAVGVIGVDWGSAD